MKKEMEITIEKEPYSTIKFYSGTMSISKEKEIEFSIELSYWDGLGYTVNVQMGDIPDEVDFDEEEITKMIKEKFNEI